MHRAVEGPGQAEAHALRRFMKNPADERSVVQASFATISGAPRPARTIHAWTVSIPEPVDDHPSRTTASGRAGSAISRSKSGTSSQSFSSASSRVTIESAVLDGPRRVTRFAKCIVPPPSSGSTATSTGAADVLPMRYGSALAARDQVHDARMTASVAGTGAFRRGLVLRSRRSRDSRRGRVCAPRAQNGDALIPEGTLFLLGPRDDRVIGAELMLRTTFGRVSDAEKGDPNGGWGPELHDRLNRSGTRGVTDRRCCSCIDR